MVIICLTFTGHTQSDFYVLCVLPSPDSESLVGEGEGRFPLGGLSITPASLEETIMRIASQIWITVDCFIYTAPLH